MNLRRASVVLHSVWNLSAYWPGITFSRMSRALLVQMNGFGLVL